MIANFSRRTERNPLTGEVNFSALFKGTGIFAENSSHALPDSQPEADIPRTKQIKR